MSNDTRHVRSIGCTWHGSINSTKTNKVGIPCCPFCFCVLVEYPTRKMFYEGAPAYEENGHPNYVKFLEWLENRLCVRDMETAKPIFEKETGLVVVFK